MGSHFASETFDGKLYASDLRRRYERRITELLNEHGTDAYNGTLTTTSGLRIEEKTFDSLAAAEEYVQENTKKWGEALAVKFKDMRTEVAKQPTFNGKVASWPLMAGERALRTVWHVGTAIAALAAADQLTDGNKAKALALYNDWHTKERAFRQLHEAISRICRQLQDYSADPPTPDDFKELQKAIKQRARAHAAKKKATEKLTAFDLKQSAKIYVTKQVDHGVQWLVGGWAAE